MGLELMSYRVVVYGLSDIGLVRHNNEDFWIELPESRFVALADGMGGHLAGEVAAKEAVTQLCQIVESSLSPQEDINTLKNELSQAIEQVNLLVFRMGKSNENLRGMGTTLCCLYFHPKGLIYGHVGDSRIYRFRNLKLEQLTRDHSLFRELVDLGQLNEDQAGDFLYKNIITKAIGTAPKVEPSVFVTDVQEGDLYLTCSDGLSDLLTFEEIETVILEGSILSSIVERLVEMAKEKGGHDNITVVMMEINGNIS